MWEKKEKPISPMRRKNEKETFFSGKEERKIHFSNEDTKWGRKT